MEFFGQSLSLLLLLVFSVGALSLSFNSRVSFLLLLDAKFSFLLP